MNNAALNKARIMALRGQISQADQMVQTLLAESPDSSPLLNDLIRISSDCQKTGIDDVMLWSSLWILKLDSSNAAAHMRVMSFYEHKAAWPELSRALANADEQVPLTHMQRPLLNRHMARIKKKAGVVLDRTAN